MKYNFLIFIYYIKMSTPEDLDIFRKKFEAIFNINTEISDRIESNKDEYVVENVSHRFVHQNKQFKIISELRAIKYNVQLKELDLNDTTFEDMGPFALDIKIKSYNDIQNINNKLYQFGDFFLKCVKIGEDNIHILKNIISNLEIIQVLFGKVEESILNIFDPLLKDSSILDRINDSTKELSDSFGVENQIQVNSIYPTTKICQNCKTGYDDNYIFIERNDMYKNPIILYIDFETTIKNIKSILQPYCDNDISLHRLSKRKNGTYRPFEILDDNSTFADYVKYCSSCDNSIMRNNYYGLYLREGLIYEEEEGEILVSSRINKSGNNLFLQIYYIEKDNNPKKLGDIIISKDKTINDLKNIFKDVIDIDNIVVVEEEDNYLFNILESHENILYDYDLRTGDIIWFEKYDADTHDISDSLSSNYFSN
jgi:hypothetical protein